LKSLRQEAPAFIAEYLDQGKPRRIIDFGRMNRFKNQYPVVIRPDLLLTETGLVACELDSVPGGFGLTGCLMRNYEKEGLPCLGSPDGMVSGFAAALKHLAGRTDPVAAIVVSEESRMYRPEMKWLAGALTEAGLPCLAVGPEEIAFSADGIHAGTSLRSLDVVYRFFELFDLGNVVQGSALLEAAKLKRIRITPPPKAHLEEKLLFALLHHPALERLLAAELGDADLGRLKEIVIPAWVLDPRPVPPHAVIAKLAPRGDPVQSWDALAGLSNRERAFVIKPSGFSESAWGSHGVKFGPDLPQREWAGAVRDALGAFASQPHVLQEYVKPRLVRSDYYDPDSRSIREMEGRVRICPYFFVVGGEETVLGGALATVCPADKKAIHGMPDAIMIPCATPKT
jgi:hypothetical protein